MNDRIPGLRALAIFGGAMLMTAAMVGRSVAQQDPVPAKSARGGTIVNSRRHQFEIFFYKTGLRVFPKATGGTPVDLAKLTGTATFTLPGAPQPFVYRLRGDSPIAGLDPGSIDLSVDLSGVPLAGSKVAFGLAGFADGAEPSVSFAVPFDLTSTQAAPVASSSVPTQAEPTRYYYGPGYYGYTYYAVPAPGVAVAAPVPMMSPPPASYSSGSGAFHDPSTGRDLPTSISKPWLRPY